MDHIYNETIERIKAVTHTRTQTALAEILEIRQSSISDAKRRQSVPGAWYMTLFEKLGVNPDWLKSGIGPVYLRTEVGYIPGDGDGTPLAPGPRLVGLAFVAACACHHVRHARRRHGKRGSRGHAPAGRQHPLAQGIRERGHSRSGSGQRRGRA